MIGYIQLAILRFLWFIVEIIFKLLFPVFKFFLKKIDYDSALQASYQSSQGGLWIHAASLGEINAVRSLVLELCNHFPANQIVISTTTVNGLKAAQKLHPHIKSYLSVIDLPSLRAEQFKQIAPKLICIVETEIWPSFLWEAKKRELPILFLNARLSQKSLKRILPFRPLLRILGTSIKQIMAKSEEDAHRFKKIFDAQIKTAGNLKFALSPNQYPETELRQKMGFNAEDFIICMGSSRPKEEALIIGILAQLQVLKPNIKLILAPRHPNRVAEVIKLCTGFDYGLLSKNDFSTQGQSILIIDVLGQLNQAYAICDLALVGGSFYDFGGHNPLEPAFYGKPIIMGPYYSSCTESVEQLQQAEAIHISEANNLLDSIECLLKSESKRLQMGQNAKELLANLKGSLDIHLKGVLKWLN